MSHELDTITSGSGCLSADARRVHLAPLAVLGAIADRGVELSRRHATLVLRMALGTVFVWFGLLKLVGASPASHIIRDLLAATVPYVPAEPAVVLLGVIEVLIGLGFLAWITPRLTLLLFLVQMASTFSTLLFLPGSMFERGDPLLLSMSGEFVVKNLILLAAGVAVLAAVPDRATLQRRAPQRSRHPVHRAGSHPARTAARSRTLRVRGRHHPARGPRGRVTADPSEVFVARTNPDDRGAGQAGPGRAVAR
ncbi:MAG: hypothetical protein DLM58_19790 [Pseudonocardiales bacterium]|nr:MAG: hypothetical protein DLM58_19790 [Pseudonocardiales bacterium]